MVKSNNDVNMNIAYDDFAVTLVTLLKMYENVDTTSQKLLKAYVEKSNPNQYGIYIKKIYQNLTKYNNLLVSRSVDLFRVIEIVKKKPTKITIVPAINIDKFWDSLTDEQKDNTWNCLDVLYKSSYHIVHILQSDEYQIVGGKMYNDSMQIFINTLYGKFWETYPDSDLVNKRTNNIVLDGVGTNDSSYSISDLMSGPELLPDQSSSNIDNIMKMTGMGKMMNFDKLKDMFEELTPEKLDEAIEQLVSQFPSDPSDPNDSNELLKKIAHDVSDEIKNSDMKKGNPVEKIIKISENVCKKNEGINPKELIEQGRKLLKNMAQSQGDNKSIAMIDNLITKQMNKLDSLNENSYVTPKEQEKEALNDISELLKSMDVNIDINKIKNLASSGVLENIMKNRK
jgi:hypothetical protein